MRAEVTLTIGIFLFDEVEVMDFAGLFEVFSTAARLRRRAGAPAPFRVLPIGRSPGLVSARGGLQVRPHHGLGEHPKLDVLVIPGGDVSAVLRDERVIAWIADSAATARLTAAVCTGAFLLGAAGLLDGKRATTHWEDLEALRSTFPRVRVEERMEDGVRWVDEGDVITSAGISAGMDMSLHIVRRLLGAELASATSRQMDYAWRDDEAAGSAAPGDDAATASAREGD